MYPFPQDMSLNDESMNFFNTPQPEPILEMLRIAAVNATMSQLLQAQAQAQAHAAYLAQQGMAPNMYPAQAPAQAQGMAIPQQHQFMPQYAQQYPAGTR